MSESTSDDLHTAYALGRHEAKKYYTKALAVALGVHTPDPQWQDLWATVRQQRNELSRLRVAVAHQQQELHVVRARDYVE